MTIKLYNNNTAKKQWPNNKSMVAHYTAVLNAIQGENRQESTSSWYASHTKEVFFFQHSFADRYEWKSYPALIICIHTVYIMLIYYTIRI